MKKTGLLLLAVCEFYSEIEASGFSRKAERGKVKGFRSDRARKVAKRRGDGDDDSGYSFFSKHYHPKRGKLQPVRKYVKHSPRQGRLDFGPQSPVTPKREDRVSTVLAGANNRGISPRIVASPMAGAIAGPTSLNLGTRAQEKDRMCKKFKKKVKFYDKFLKQLDGRNNHL